MSKCKRAKNGLHGHAKVSVRMYAKMCAKKHAKMCAKACKGACSKLKFISKVRKSACNYELDKCELGI